MALEGGARVIKFLVVFFNFIFFVFGGLLIGIGAWTLIKFGDYITFSDDLEYASGSKVMIAAGVLIAVISFMGCCGAWKENRCMLVIFFICLLVILGLEIAAAALGYQHRNEVDKEVDDNIIKELQQHFGEKGSEGTTDGFNKLQEMEKCCGWLSYKEWYQAKVFNGSHWVPDTCCKEKKDKCGQTQDTDLFYTDPCKDKLRNLLYYIGAVGVTVVVIQVLGMIFAIVLIVKIGKSGTYA